jgi:hypothetical protein
MAEFTRVNPVATTTNYEVVGKDITFFTVDYINAVNGSAGPNGAQAAVLRTIQTNATIIAAGPLVDTNSQQTFAVEGDFNITAKWDGTNDETWFADLEDRIQALGTVDGVSLASATVTATKLGILTAAAVA